MKSETSLSMKGENIGSAFRKLLDGQVERPLVWLWGAVPSFAVQNVGYPPVAAYNDPAKSFDAQIKTIAMYGEDGIPRMAVGGASDVTWAFGGEIRWPDGDYDMAPVAIRFPVASDAEFETLHMPEDATTAGALPMYFAFAEICRRHSLPAFPFVTSPIEGARSLCGPETLMRWMLKRPERAHRLLRISLEYSAMVVRLFADRFGPENVMVYVAAPTASNQMISPEAFEKFVLPYQKQLHEHILNTGIRHIFCHICGEHNRNLGFWEKIPMGNPGIVSFGHEIDLKTAVERFGARCVIAGNIEPAVIHVGDANEVYRLCREALEKAAEAPCGFILMPGCGIPPHVPPYNLFMLKKALTDHLLIRRSASRVISRILKK